MYNYKQTFSKDWVKDFYGDFLNTEWGNTIPNSYLAIEKKEKSSSFLETKDGYVIELEVPGIEKEKIKIYSKDGNLLIEFKDRKDKEQKYSYKAKKFDLSKVEPTLKDGLLTIKIPFSEDSKENLIEIK
jgi:HSP20 family molecular chaperone IbpA